MVYASENQQYTKQYTREEQKKLEEDYAINQRQSRYTSAMPSKNPNKIIGPASNDAPQLICC